MNPALWGTCTAVSWGTADFIARFTGRGLGHANALLGMLIVGALAMTLYVVAAGAPLTWDWSAAWLVVVSGVGVMFATLFLYQGLAIGPVTVVAPIVGSYPALVIVIALLQGIRPSLLQWGAMGVVMAGVVIVARAAGTFEEPGGWTRAALRQTVLVALLSAVCFAVAVSAGQAATPAYGEVQTVWVSRLIGLAALLPMFLLPAYELRLPLRWWPLLAAQGALDTGAYLTLFAGSAGEGAAIAAVTASGFGAVTVLLARVFLRERMSGAQWGGIALIFAGVAVLASKG